MEEVLKTIIEKNKSLFGINPQIERINIGFTNTIFVVNNEYVIKICSDIDNEEKFNKEIDFYNANKTNELIPKLYVYNKDKKDVPYIYEVLERIEGETLYNVWHTLDELEREDIIRQLCEAMKQFHNKSGESYDWPKKTCELFVKYYNKALSQELFNEEEQDIINSAYLKFDKYLQSDEFVLVHNDLHFDNILYHDGKIKLIDFERSLYAPRDFELDILYRMVRKPRKFASEETEKFVKRSDYENIMIYIEKYYPRLIHIDNLYQRLAIYEIIYYLKQYISNPSIEELKKNIISAAKYVAIDLSQPITVDQE